MHQLALLIALLSSPAVAGVVTFLDVEADRATTVTGSQSNDIASAAAHGLRTDNPHQVTAASIGALTNEADTLAIVASRGGFAGTETIVPLELFCGTPGIYGITYGEYGMYGNYLDGKGVSLTTTTGLTVYDPFSEWIMSGTTLHYKDNTTGAVTEWSLHRENGGGYTVAATADITAHNADTNAHPDKVDAHTATNIAVAVQSSGLTYYLAGNTVSDRVSSMTNRLMTQTYTLASNAVNSITQTVPSNNFYVAAFITASNTVVQPIAPGVIQVHAHIAFTDIAVNSTAFITVELYRKNAEGVDVDEFGSGEILPLVEGGAITDYTWAIPVTTRIDGTGYRYGLKFKIVNSTISGADTITLQTEGGTLSRLVVPVNNGIFVTEPDLPWRNGTLYGTNGTYRTVGTNTYWILTP